MTETSSYLDLLPTSLREAGPSDETPFIGQFLLALEAILSGVEDAVVEDRPVAGLDAQLDTVHSYFDPESAPEEFLPWLSNWVGLSLRDDWSVSQQRRFLSRVVPLYRLRGTKAGLEQMLSIYTNMGVEIAEFTAPLQVGQVSTIGVDTVIGGGPPHYFTVRMFTDERDPEARSRVERIARAIIDQEKPAHTTYRLEIETPTLQIGVFSTLGVDTLLGDKPSND